MGMVHTAHNPDSWEGWHWGGMHMWGNSHRLGIPEQYDLLEDALKHTEMIVFWSSDPETTGGGIYAAFESTSRRYWMKELGIKMVFVDPYYNHTAELFSDKWFAPRLGTDVAFGLGIAYIWLTEDLYDKEYVAERTHRLRRVEGLRPRQDRRRAQDAGVGRGGDAASRPARSGPWPASGAAKKTMLAAGGLGGWGGACRSATGNEWARTMIALAAMQGYGKPGVQHLGHLAGRAVSDCVVRLPRLRRGRHVRRRRRSRPPATACSTACSRTSTGLHPTVNAHDSTEGIAIPRLRIPEAMMHEKFEWRGKGFCGPSIQSQMQKYEYPAPGYPFVTMYWRYGGSFFGTMQQTNRYVKAYREGKRAHRGQPVHLDGGRGQVRRHHPAGLHQLRALGHQRVRQLLGLHPGQPHPDQPPRDRLPEEVHRAARREQVGLRHLRRRGRAPGRGRRLHRGRHGRVRLVPSDYFDATDLPKIITWEEFEKKGYVVVPFPEDHKSTPAMRWFAEGRKRDTPDWGPRPGDTVGLEGLQTPSGKIEFVSKTLQNLETGRRSTPSGRPWARSTSPAGRATTPPSCTASTRCRWCRPHPRFSFHTMGDSKEHAG